MAGSNKDFGENRRTRVDSSGSGTTRTKAWKISLGGIMMALTLVSLFLSSVIPTNTLSFYVLSSFFISVVVIEAGTKSGAVFYAASVLLALVIIPDKTGVLAYGAFFGYYGLIKFFIERLDKIVLEILLKYVVFNIPFLAAFFFMKDFFTQSLNLNFALWIILIGFEVAFAIYDYVYTLFIQYYSTKLKKVIGGNR